MHLLKQNQQMKILVAISNVPDTTAKIQFTEGNTKFNSAGVTFVINPYDEWYALVRALELKEAGKAEKVTLSKDSTTGELHVRHRAHESEGKLYYKGKLVAEKSPI